MDLNLSAITSFFNILNIICHPCSAVETLFSQYKYNAGGKLDAVNYATARAASLVKQVVSSHHFNKN